MNYRWTLLILAILLAGCSAAASQPQASDLRGAVFDPPRELTDFSLMSTSGEPFTLSEHRTQVILLYFGYRSCPDFCPTTFAELRRVYLELGEPANQVKIVFITIDPERDDLESLALYTHAFHEDFIGLRAEGEALEQVKGQFGVTAERRQLADSALSYVIDHTASVFLIGPDGRLQVQYLYGTDYQNIVHDVRLILQASS